MNVPDAALPAAGPATEDPLRAGLARANRALASIPAVLGHLVGDAQPELFSDAVVAQARGMMESLAVQLVRRTGAASPQAVERLAAQLSRHDALLAHCHAAALEGLVTERLARDGGGDPVLSPLLQDMIGSSDPDLQALAMVLLASQARFIQRQRRIEAALDELPADLLHDVATVFVQTCGAEAEAVSAEVHDSFDEGRIRQALLAQALLAGDGAMARSLDPAQAGIALFASGLSLATGIERSAVILSLVKGQEVRLALLLAAAGVGAAEAEAAMVHFHAEPGPMRDVGGLAPEHALHMLLEKA